MTKGERAGVPLHKILIGMLAGAGVRGTLNALVGGDTPALRWAIDHVADPVGQLLLEMVVR